MPPVYRKRTPSLCNRHQVRERDVCMLASSSRKQRFNNFRKPLNQLRFPAPPLAYVEIPSAPSTPRRHPSYRLSVLAAAHAAPTSTEIRDARTMAQRSRGALAATAVGDWTGQYWSNNNDRVTANPVTSRHNRLSREK